jgi:hypothetical protein
MVKIDEFGGTEEERKAAVKRYQADLDVIIGTLPERSEPNRTQTIQILKRIAIPNPFNEQKMLPLCLRGYATLTSSS